VTKAPAVLTSSLRLCWQSPCGKHRATKVTEGPLTPLSRLFADEGRQERLSRKRGRQVTRLSSIVGLTHSFKHTATYRLVP
jgi:hypothetical protein